MLQRQHAPDVEGPRLARGRDRPEHAAAHQALQVVDADTRELGT